VSIFKRFSPTKVITCSNCKTKIKFPVKMGKRLRVTCPKCRSSYDVSFVNPLMQLIKGQLKWRTLSKDDKRRLIIIIMALLVSLGLIFSSFKKPVNPSKEKQDINLSYVI